MFGVLYYGYSFFENDFFYAIYHIIQFLHTMVILVLFLSFTILSFLSPRYLSENKLKEFKSKFAKDAAFKIRELKKLLDEGIISKEVFDEKSKKYIEEL